MNNKKVTMICRILGHVSGIHYNGGKHVAWICCRCKATKP